MSAVRTLRSRVARLAASAVDRLQLDLKGLRVLTEAATGLFAVTPSIAALAGAQVTALARPSRHGSVEDARQDVVGLAGELGVAAQVEVVEALGDKHVARADVVTNSGHLRPLDAGLIARMKPGAVIPLMYEAWELRSTDVDVAACARQGIAVAGVNERHALAGVFQYLGPLAVKCLLEAGHELLGETCLLVSDNDFAAYIKPSLEANGLRVHHSADGSDARGQHWDVVVLAATPPLAGGRAMDLRGIEADLLCQLWGDVQHRDAHGTWRPDLEPPPGHMGFSLASLGPAPVARLQAAGLKCAELMVRGTSDTEPGLVQWVVRPQNPRVATRGPCPCQPRPAP